MQTNILEYLERTVRRLPEKIAYTDGTYGLTFREVYGAARSVGSFLAAEGFYREPVVVYMKKSPDAIAAFSAPSTAAVSMCPLMRRCQNSGRH